MRKHLRHMSDCIMRLAMALLIVPVLSGCAKMTIGDEDEPAGDGDYTIRFSVSDYTMTDFDDSPSATKSMRRERKEARQLGSVLNFAVFKDGEKVVKVNQKSDDDGFGTISANLSEGTYQVVVLIHSCSGNATISSPEKITFPDNKVTDTFAYCSDLTVNGNGECPITVERIVAKFRMTLADAIPDNVTQLQFAYTGGSSTLDATTLLGCVNSRQKEIRTVVDHAAGQEFEIYSFPKSENNGLNLTVTAMDASGKTVKANEYKNVPIEKNKITTYTGKFFTESSGEEMEGDAHIVIGGDDAWEEEIEYQ